MNSSKSHYLWIAFTGLCTLIAISCYHRIVHIDDAWLGEQVYFLSQLGYVKSELWQGLLSYEKQLFVYHKGFISFGAFFSGLFGFGIYTLKSVSLVCLGLVSVLVYKYIHKNINPVAAIFSLCLLFSSHYVFEYSFVFRPELALMLVGFSQFLLIDSYLKNNKLSKLLLCAVLGGFGVYIHLNALIFLVPVGLLLLINKKIPEAFIHGLLSLAVASLYFLDVGITNINTWMIQFNNDPAVVGIKLSLFDRLTNVLKEHQRWFSHHHNIAYSLLFFFCLIKYRAQQYKNEIIFLAGAAISLSILSHGQTGKYLLLYYPFIILVIVRAFTSISKPTKTLSVLLVLMLAVNHWQNLELINRNYDIVNYNEKAFKNIPEGEKVVSYLPSLFDKQLSLYDIYADKLGMFLQERYKKQDFDINEYLSYYSNLGIKHFLLSEKHTPNKILEGFRNLKAKGDKALEDVNLVIVP